MKTRTTPLPDFEISRDRERGLALFVVMVVVVVLSVLVYELSYTTKVEERIYETRKDAQEIDYALQSVARGAILRLYDDMSADAGVSDSSSSGASGSGSGGSGSGGGGLPSNLSGLLAGGQSGGGGGSSSAGGIVDGLHEAWATIYQENINGVLVLGRILDGEGRIDLNHLFEYVHIDQESVQQVPSAGQNSGNQQQQGTPGDQQSNQENPDGQDADQNPPVNLPPDVPYDPPTPEQEDAARSMLSRLIQGIIQTNEEARFFYDTTPDADRAADAIVNWVLSRQSQPETRYIRSIDELKDLDEISWELFNGPPVPQEDDSQASDSIQSPSSSSSSSISQSDFDQNGLDGTQQIQEFVELKDGTGVERVPRPIGLRDVLTAFSTGKLNLNTAPREVIAALLVNSFENYDDARDVASQIAEYRNQYSDVNQNQNSATASPPPPSDSTDAESEKDHEYNTFKSIQNLSDVNEDWSTNSSGTQSIFDLLKTDLQDVAVFRSTFFTARLLGTKEDAREEGEVVLKRKNAKIKVLWWHGTRF